MKSNFYERIGDSTCNQPLLSIWILSLYGINNKDKNCFLFLYECLCVLILLSKIKEQQSSIISDA
ncbi:hypothetical protein DERP_005879 [Dermatophagoides pteronyssinus]|uniref:Uncharacterized protein n=1 Tax=Dermatophagoides pteronyssinus TaxID=6956 RepID=A0ABQ8J9X8_DERPT|nr:hypothetical protein DERP_005879 [Dermatophagoides pteronyssinus]